MSVDVETRIPTGVPPYPSVALAVALLHGRGRLNDDAALASVNVGSRRSQYRMWRDLTSAARPLLAVGIVEHVDGEWRVPDLPDLGAWVADALADRADAGHVDTVIPVQRRAAA